MSASSEMKIRLILIGAVVTLMFMGASVVTPTMVIPADYKGDIPGSRGTPNSSSVTSMTGQGSNIGIAGYSNGTKSGSFYNDPSNWSADARTNAGYYMRSPSIQMLVPSGTTAWTVKSVHATVSNLLDTHEFISDPDFSGGTWIGGQGSTGNPFNIAGNEGPTLVSNGASGLYTDTGSTYFNSHNSLAFQIGSFHKTYETGATEGWNTGSATGSNSQTRSGSSGSYERIGGSNQNYLSSQYSIYGYRDSYSGISWYEDAYYDNNGGVPPANSDFQNIIPTFNPDASTGVLTATLEYWSYGSIGRRTQTIYDTTVSATAFVSMSYDDHATMQYWVLKNINYNYNGSAPQSAVISFNTSRVQWSYTDWFDTPTGNRDSSAHDVEGSVILELQLYSPDGVRRGTYTVKFAEGPDSTYPTTEYIKDDNQRSINWDVTDLFRLSTATGSWYLNISVTINMRNWASFSDVASDTVSGTSTGAYAATCIELRDKSRLGCIVKDIYTKIDDDIKWDNGNAENYIWFKTQQIPFNQRTVPDGAEPTVTFDWYVPQSIVGPRYEEGLPNDYLQYASPVAMIEYVKGAQTYQKMLYDFDGDTLASVRDRTVGQTSWSWLGDSTEKGLDHFVGKWTTDYNLLSGADYIVVYVGFRFTRDFVTDWRVGVDNLGVPARLYITNVSLEFDSMPHPRDIDMELVWERDPTSTAPDSYVAVDIQNGAVTGDGYYSGDMGGQISAYTSPTYYPSGAYFYFRIVDSSVSCYFDWNLTLVIEYQDWGITTTYKITSGGSAEFYANFTMDIPHVDGMDAGKGYEDTFWFDVIFPRYQMVPNGEPYWDLVMAYESNNTRILLGEENLNVSQTNLYVIVYENATVDTNSPEYGRYLNNPLTSAQMPYHQFGRFHNDLISYFYSVGKTQLYWNILWRAPNYVKAITLSKNSDFSTNDTKFYTNEYCMVMGTYTVDMVNFTGLSDIGDSWVFWYYPNNTLLDSYHFTSADILTGVTNNNVTTKHIMTTEPPGSGYSAAFFYNDSDVWGGTGSGCYGVFRLGYMTADFASQRGSLVKPDGLWVEANYHYSSDGVPTIDTGVNRSVFRIVVTWLDAIDGVTPITGGDVRITISAWEMATDISKAPVIMDAWNNVPMTQMANGSYVIWVDPEYYGHEYESGTGPANMTQGFHNFTIVLSKDGYDPKVVTGNFSIVYDTYMRITHPLHSMFEDLTNRPHFDYSNAFARKEYQLTVTLRHNLTSEDPIYNGSGLFRGMVRGNYTLIGWRPAGALATDPINTTLDGIINWSWFIDTYYNGTPPSGPDEWVDTFVNGSLHGGVTSAEYNNNITWPAFTEMKAPLYTPDIRVYYNVCMWVEVNRTQYVNGTSWQPSDVQPQSCEDNNSIGTQDDPAIKVREEIFGLQIHKEDTGNATMLSLTVEYTGLDGEPFSFPGSVFKPDLAHEGKYEDYAIVNYWYNATHPKFRLRARFNCTMGGSINGPVPYAPPVGPLNDTPTHYGEDISSWSGWTNITLVGWNSTELNLTADYAHLWNATVKNSSEVYFTAWGVTYVSPWLTYNESDVTGADSFKELFISAHKPGFIDDYIRVRVYILPQETGVFNATDGTIQFGDDEPRWVNITTPVGIPTSFEIRYNDTTNAEWVGIEGASIDCIDDDWAGKYSDGEGNTWSWTEVGDGVYRIYLNDTDYSGFSEVTEKFLQFRIYKGNYTAATFKVHLTLVPRQMKIIYLEGKDIGPLIPRYVTKYTDFTQLKHIWLTFAVLDLSNNSEEIDFTTDQIINYFRFRYGDTVKNWEVSVQKVYNSTGDLVYNITVNTQLDEDFNLGEFQKDFVFNFSIGGIGRYYPAWCAKNITITAVETAIQMIDPADFIQETRYIWNSSEYYEIHCPRYSLNWTDVTHSKILGINLAINPSSVILVSNYSNPNRNGVAAINPNSASNEDIEPYTKSALDGNGNSYYYLEFIVDTRGIDAQDTFWFNVTLRQANFKDASVNLGVHILNATTGIEDDKVYYFKYDPQYRQSKSLPTEPYAIEESWPVYRPEFGLEVPWGMTLALKCGYQSGQLLIVSDAEDRVTLAIEGVNNATLWPDGAEPQVYEDVTGKQMFFWFKTNIAPAEAVNLSVTIVMFKKNFEPATYTVNFTVRPRKTFIFNETMMVQSVAWAQFATFTLQYTDLDIDGTGIQYAEINGTGDGEEGPLFDFGNGLTARWDVTLEPFGQGRYTVRINTTALQVRDEPYVFHFRITKTDSRGVEHYEAQVFNFTLWITPVKLQIDHYFMLGDQKPNPAGQTPIKSGGFAISIDPEQYSYFTVYIQVYTTVNGIRHYITSEDDISIVGTIYDWNDENYYNTSDENRLTIIHFKFVEDPDIAGGGWWVAKIEIKFLNPADLVSEGMPQEVVLNRLNGLVINFTVKDPNYEDTSSNFQFLVISGQAYIPWYFYLMVGAVTAVGAGMAGYGIRKAILLRIPYVLRMIDESIDKISKDKFPTVGVMMGRSEYVINLVIEYLDMCGIEWETADKYEIEEGAEGEEEGGLPPLTKEELAAELEKIESLTPEERELFIEELLQLDRKAQLEFIESLKEEQ